MRPLVRVLLFAWILLLAAGCGGSAAPAGAPAVPEATAAAGDAQEAQPAEAATAPAEAEAPAEAAVEAPTAEPTAEPVPTDTAVPPSPTPAPVGLSRANPAPAGEMVSGLNWDFQVLETLRGDDAWAALQTANQFNEPAPEGKEYLLTRVKVASTHEDSEPHLIGGYDFWVTGDSQQLVGVAGAVTPEPALQGELFAGGETEGWIAYLIPQGEGNLMLMLDESLTFEASPYRFVALDEGAAVTAAVDLAAIEANDLGPDRSSLVPLGETVVTEDWEVTILESISGDEAWTRLQEANQFNEPAAEGQEYALVRVAVRYIGGSEEPTTVDNSFFKATGDANVVDDYASAVAPEPKLSARLFPGGRAEGWVVVTFGAGETGRMLIFEPFLDMSGANTRYLAVGP
jgi:hypothetical protein